MFSNAWFLVQWLLFDNAHALKVGSMIFAARGVARLGRSAVTASIYSSVRQREVTARVGET